MESTIEWNIKENQIWSPLLLSGPKIRKAYFSASNSKMLLQWPPLKSDFNGGLWSKNFRFETSK